MGPFSLPPARSFTPAAGGAAGSRLCGRAGAGTAPGHLALSCWHRAAHGLCRNAPLRPVPPGWNWEHTTAGLTHQRERLRPTRSRTRAVPTRGRTEPRALGASRNRGQLLKAATGRRRCCRRSWRCQAAAQRPAQGQLLAEPTSLVAPPRGDVPSRDSARASLPEEREPPAKGSFQTPRWTDAAGSEPRSWSQSRKSKREAAVKPHGVASPAQGCQDQAPSTSSGLILHSGLCPPAPRLKPECRAREAQETSRERGLAPGAPGLRLSIPRGRSRGALPGG